jgi:hypothetical protein
MYDRDVQSIKLVGSLCVGLGAVLFLLTALGSLFALFALVSANSGNFFRGVLSAVLGLIMSITLISCGSELQRTKPTGRANLENLRLVWTALVVMMVLCLIAALFLIPPLVGISGLVLFAAFTIRGAIIRLTS